MEDFVKQIASPVWWLSTVVVAFMVNIVAAYAKPFFDRTVARWSKKRSQRIEEKMMREDAVVDYVIEDPHRLVDLRTDAIFTALRMLIAFSIAVFWTSLFRFVERYVPIYLFTDLILVIIYVYCLVLLLRYFNRYRILHRLIEKCYGQVYTYDKMPVDVVQRLRREDEST